jgi:NAD(P)H-nitrite reductase large subunit
MKHVIIGSGAAGIAAAKTIRSLNKTDEISLISIDNTIYSRCMLHKYTGNELNLDRLSFIPNNFFSANNITWYKGERVNGLDTKNNHVLLQNKNLSYDKLLIATGSETAIPNVGEFRTATNVYGFRNLADAQMIREKSVDAKKIFIVGAGLAGLSVAYALLKLKKPVTIIAKASHIMPSNLDTSAATTYQKIFEQNGCTFKLDGKVTNTISNEKGEITHLTLETGENLNCDMVIVTAGASPAIKFLDNSEIECDRGIKVNQYLRTSCENVYAAGSVTSLGEIWQCAVKQGETAAKNMCNIKTPFTDTFTAKNAINFFDLPTISIGQINPEKDDTILIRENSNGYQKIILRNNFVIGVILQGNIDHSGIWQYLIKNKIDLSNFKKSIWDLSFADFYDIDEKGQYKYKT